MISEGSISVCKIFDVKSYPVISTSLISTSRYLDISLRSRQKQSLFNIKLPGYLDISISTSRYLDIISNPHAGFSLGPRPMGGDKSAISGPQNRIMVILGPKNA